MIQRNDSAAKCALETGFTLVEITIAATALLALSLMVGQLVLSGHDAQQYANRLNSVTSASQRAVDAIKQELRSAVRIFGDDAIGQAYRQSAQPWIGYTPLLSSRLPKIETSGNLNKDQPSEEKTGNDLLFARHAWSDSYKCASGKSYRVDILRLTRFFLISEGSSIDGSSGGLNLVKWTSEPLASSSQVNLIADDADRKEFLVHLLAGTHDKSGNEHDAVAVVWALGGDPGAIGTLREIQIDGSLTDTPQPPRSNPWEFELAEHLSTPGLFFSNRHSIASNRAPANRGVSRFAIRDDSAGLGDGFPHGFEVQVVGPPAARKVLIHLTTVNANAGGLRAFFDAQIVVNVREG